MTLMVRFTAASSSCLWTPSCLALLLFGSDSVKAQSGFIASDAARHRQRGGAAADLRGAARRRRPAWGFRLPTLHLDKRLDRNMYKKLTHGRYVLHYYMKESPKSGVIRLMVLKNNQQYVW